MAMEAPTPAIDYFYDEESRNWHFRVPALGINGGGDATREAATRHAADVVAFTLRCLEREAEEDRAAARRQVG